MTEQQEAEKVRLRTRARAILKPLVQDVPIGSPYWDSYETMLDLVAEAYDAGASSSDENRQRIPPGAERA